MGGTPPALTHGIPASALTHGIPGLALTHGIPDLALTHGIPAPALTHGVTSPNLFVCDPSQPLLMVYPFLTLLPVCPPCLNLTPCPPSPALPSPAPQGLVMLDSWQAMEKAGPRSHPKCHPWQDPTGSEGVGVTATMYVWHDEDSSGHGMMTSATACRSGFVPPPPLDLSFPISLSPGPTRSWRGEGGDEGRHAMTMMMPDATPCSTPSTPTLIPLSTCSVGGGPLSLPASSHALSLHGPSLHRASIHSPDPKLLQPLRFLPPEHASPRHPRRAGAARASPGRGQQAVAATLQLHPLSHSFHSNMHLSIWRMLERGVPFAAMAKADYEAMCAAAAAAVAAGAGTADLRGSEAVAAGACMAGLQAGAASEAVVALQQLLARSLLDLSCSGGGRGGVRRSPLLPSCLCSPVQALTTAALEVRHQTTSTAAVAAAEIKG